MGGRGRMSASGLTSLDETSGDEVVSYRFITYLMYSVRTQRRLEVIINMFFIRRQWGINVLIKG